MTALLTPRFGKEHRLPAVLIPEEGSGESPEMLRSGSVDKTAGAGIAYTIRSGEAHSR